MNYFLIITIIISIVLTHIIGQYIGTKREIGYGKSIFYSILFTPIIGFFITLLSKRVDNK